MRLPVYEQQVRLQGRNRTDLNVRANPNAFGAQVGAAVEGLGTAVGKVAQAKIFKEALIADADARKGLNEYIDETRNVLYDPNTGALVQTGENGMGANRAAAEERLKERRRQIEENLGPQAKKVFADAADRLEDNSADALIKHDAQETRTYRNGQAAAVAGNFMNLAMDNYSDDAKWKEYTGAALAEVADNGRLNGLSADEIKLKQTELLQQSHGNRAIRLAYDDPIKADAYLDANREMLGEAEYTRLKTGMEAAVVESKAEQVIDELRGSDAYVGKKPGTGNENWLVYANEGKKRALPIAPKLVNSMAFLQDMGITMEVGSGGQKSKAELIAEGTAQGLSGPELAAFVGARRTGSERHDHGEAADARFYKDGRLLDWTNPQDLPYFKEIIARAKANGVTGFGAGESYMGKHTIHIGFGNPGVWGAGGAGGNAAAWLVEAYAGAALGATPTGNGDVAAPDAGHSTRSAYEAIMKIEDPKVRDAAMAKLEGQLKTEAALSAEDQRAATDEAWKLYTQEGMRPQDIPMDLQIKMGREQTLTFFESARAYESGTLVTDEERYSELQRLAVEDRDAFVGLNLNDERMNFSKGDFRVIEAMQLDLKEALQKSETEGTNTLNDPATMQKVYTAAEQIYNDAVPAAGSKRTNAEAAAYNRFQSQVKSYARDFMLEKGREMTFDEQDRLFSMLLTPIIIDKAGWGGEREAMLFDAPFREAGSAVRGNVPAGDIALIDEEEARLELRDFYGRDPSEDEITVHHNRKLLANMGISPEMDYSEIPKDIRKKMVGQYPDASDEELVDLYVEFVLETAKRE